MMKSLLFAGGLALCGAVSAGETVLLWMVQWDDLAEDYANSSVTQVKDLTEHGSEQHPEFARVRVTGGETTGLGTDKGTYLNVWAWTEGQTPSEGVFEAGLTDVHFSPDSMEGRAGRSWAQITGYTSSEYKFTIELGYYDEGDNWVTLAYGATETYADLESFHATGDLINDPTYIPWQSSYHVPEPSSGLLLLMGGALLALRRKRRIR